MRTRPRLVTSTPSALAVSLALAVAIFGGALVGGCGTPVSPTEGSGASEGASTPGSVTAPGAGSEASEAPNVVGTTPPGQVPPACSHGDNDDYLHPERFYDSAGKVGCVDGVVIFDHQITPKFLRTIIPEIAATSGVTIDTNLVDFYITLPETGEEVVFEDIFNWYVGGERALFNTNVELWQRWRSHLDSGKTHTFDVKMIHRPTGADISLTFRWHETMVLNFNGLS